MGRIRVFLTDDHTILLEAFTKLLEPRFEIVGSAVDGREMLAKAPGLRPDVVVLDVSMPNLNGVDAARRLREVLPEAKVVFLTMNRDPAVASEALAGGAHGYVLKDGDARELEAAIESAIRGQTFVTPLLANEVLALRESGSAKAPRLTLRQREVLQLTAEGHSMKAIAARLHITPRTVAHHKYRMMDELGVATTAELVRWAVRHGIVSS